VLAHPVSSDNVPTSDNQEDHVSMGMSAALFALESLAKTETVIAVEALCAAQGLESGEGQPGNGSSRLHSLIRERVQALGEDRPPGPDIELVRDLLVEGRIAALVTEAVGSRSSAPVTA
jgi:histidine ammonia-lyase